MSTHRKARQAENRPKAEARQAERMKASKGQNVAPGTFSGKTITGYVRARLDQRRAIRVAILEKAASDEG